MPRPDAGHEEVVLNSLCTFVSKGGVDLDMSIEGVLVVIPGIGQLFSEVLEWGSELDWIIIICRNA